MALSRAQAGTVLANLGFRVNTSARLTQAIKDFQRGWNLGTALGVDGVVGPKTSAALTLSEARRRKGLGTISAHFSFREFACNCGGKYASCRRIWMLRTQIQRLETYRTRLGKPVKVVSGCRCPSYNAAIGGASKSQHQYGAATDLQGPDKDTLASWHIFAGIGYGGHSDTVKHVDSRDKSEYNGTGGYPNSPTKWVYPGW